MMVAMRKGFQIPDQQVTHRDAPAGALSSAAGTKSAAKAIPINNDAQKIPSSATNNNLVFDIILPPQGFLF